MSAAAHPHLQERDRGRRRRRHRALIGMGVMVGLLAAAIIVLWVNAGRWGVPMFGFTNEYGSHCRNDWLGYECSELTSADVERHLGVQLPANTRIVSATWRQTHDYEFTGRLVFPEAVAREGWDRLTEVYGECRHDLPSSLDDEQGLSGLCVMTNEGGVGSDPGPRIWRIATATQPDGDTVVALHIRSR